MKMYRVSVRVEAVLEYEVEAASKADALTEAMGMAEGGDFAAEDIFVEKVDTAKFIRLVDD